VTAEAALFLATRARTFGPSCMTERTLGRLTRTPLEGVEGIAEFVCTSPEAFA
jgi:hypothetical protein